MHLGHLLNFYKLYHRPILKHTKDKRLDMIPTDQWWVIMYAVSPVIDSINVTFTELHAKSLLIVQHEILVQNLLGRIIAMFGVEIVLPCDDDEDSSLRVLAMVIVHHIENQGSFPRDCYCFLEAVDQQDVVSHITKYVLVLFINL